MYSVWYVPLACVAARADRRPPFHTHPPEYCPGTGNRSVGGTDTGWSSTNTHTNKDKTSACQAKKQCQLLVLHMSFLWKGHSHELPVTVNFSIEITSHEFHLKFSHMNFTWKHLCRLDTIKSYHMHLICNKLFTWNFLTWNVNAL